jgi:hypothetical protein
MAYSVEREKIYIIERRRSYRSSKKRMRWQRERRVVQKKLYCTSEGVSWNLTRLQPNIYTDAQASTRPKAEDSID